MSTRNKVVGALVAALLLGGCTGTDEPSPSPTPSESHSVSPMPTPSANPTSQTPPPEPSPTAIESFPPPPEGETEEQAAIREGWEAYRTTDDRYAKDPDLNDWSDMESVTTGIEAQRSIERIMELRELNLKMTGDSVFRDVVIGNVETTNGIRSADVSSCLDPSNQVVVNIDTDEPSAHQNENSLLETVTMDLGSDGVWRAALYKNEIAEC